MFITANTNDEAHRIAATLLEKKKAACVNIVPEVDSRFWWKGKLDSARECLLVVKSKTSLLPEIINLVKSIHSNTVPEIIALPVIGGSRDYLDWIDEEVS